jgi:NAD+ synthase (glutamine-hydrolysing)
MLGMLLSDDLRDETQPLHPAAELRLAGADLLLAPAASPFRAGIVARRVHDARRALRPLAYVNAVGASDGVVFDGGSFVLDGEGRVVVQLPRFREAVECVDLSAALAALQGGDLSSEEEIFEALALGVRDFVAKNGLPRVVLGLSGGVDSALVAAIAAAAVGPQRVSAVALPSRHTDPRSTEAAREVATRLGIGFELRSIDSLHQAARHVVADLLDGSEAASVVDENLQARLRALVLLALANRRGGLLLNTSNRTELALGYGTLHGDLAGTLCVIGDLPKTTVFAVARWHAQRFGSIPAFVLERAPTAELRPGQVDPFDYDRVVPIVESLLTGRASAGTAEEERLRQLIRASEHKRAQAGIVLQVSDRAFGTGLAPVTRAF